MSARSLLQASIASSFASSLFTLYDQCRTLVIEASHHHDTTQHKLLRLTHGRGQRQIGGIWRDPREASYYADNHPKIGHIQGSGISLSSGAARPLPTLQITLYILCAALYTSVLAASLDSGCRTSSCRDVRNDRTRTELLQAPARGTKACDTLTAFIVFNSRDQYLLRFSRQCVLAVCNSQAWPVKSAPRSAQSVSSGL